MSPPPPRNKKYLVPISILKDSYANNFDKHIKKYTQFYTLLKKYLLSLVMMKGFHTCFSLNNTKCPICIIFYFFKIIQQCPFMKKECSQKT